MSQMEMDPDTLEQEWAEQEIAYQESQKHEFEFDQHSKGLCGSGCIFCRPSQPDEDMPF
jgi:hypothetical protein